MPLGQVAEGRTECRHLPPDAGEGVAQVEPQGRQDLIVAGAPRVNLPSHVPGHVGHESFNDGVAVLILRGNGNLVGVERLKKSIQGDLGLVQLPLREHVDLAEPPGMGTGGPYVVGEE